MKQVVGRIAGSVVLLASMLGFAQSRVETPSVLSDKDEVRIGVILVRKFLQEEGNLPTPQTRRFEAYLQKVGDKVVAHAQRKLPYRFHFDPDPSFRSAFALPGGHIVVGAGILAYMDSEDQLAGVLAHEVEHVDLNQCRERLAKELGEKHLSVATANKLTVDPFLPGYGHNNEFAADLAGVKLSMAAGYSPYSMIRLLKTYVILGEQMTHTQNEARKNLEERIAQLQALIDESGVPEPAKETPLGFR